MHMLVVKVELHSAIDGRIETLGEMVIANDGTGTNTKGNYDSYVIRKGAKLYETMRRIYRGDANPVRKGKVEGYSRISRPVWDLVALALKNMGYGK